MVKEITEVRNRSPYKRRTAKREVQKGKGDPPKTESSVGAHLCPTGPRARFFTQPFAAVKGNDVPYFCSTIFLSFLRFAYLSNGSPSNEPLVSYDFV